MLIRFSLRPTVLFGTCLLVASCGGGSNTPVVTNAPVPPINFSAATAYNQTVGLGFQFSGNVTGTAVTGAQSTPVTGTASIVGTAANVATSFNGQSALQGTITLSGNLVINGTTTPYSSASNVFLSAQSAALLGSSTSAQYCVVATYVPPPTLATIGSFGPIATLNCFTDSTMTVAAGTETQGYQISSGTTAANATVSIITTDTSISGATVAKTQVDFLVDVTGNVTFKDAQAQGSVNGTALSFTLQ